MFVSNQPTEQYRRPKALTHTRENRTRLRHGKLHEWAENLEDAASWFNDWTPLPQILGLFIILLAIATPR